MNDPTSKYPLRIAGILVLVVGCIALYVLWSFWEQNNTLKAEIATLTAERDTITASSTAALEEASTTIHTLAEQLSLTEEELDDIEDDLRREEERNDAFAEQIEGIAGTVSDLDKLSKTDEELLQKYSKVYFLNEHYVPSDLDQIDKPLVYNEDRAQFLHAKVTDFFEDMVKDAKDDGIDLWVVSAYRSFDTQAQLKGAYTITYGSGANIFSADQGYSEHQLGTTIDFTTTGLGGGLQGFDATAAYDWLVDNAYKYGFTLSYPEDNEFYVYEPWHWRFVGTALAEDLHDDGKHFYDLAQREIDAYLLHIFD